MYVGGVISRHKKQFNLTLPGFSGCIKHFSVDGEEHNLLTTSRDVVPCSYTKDTSYIHDGGFTTFDPLRNHGRSSPGQPVEFSLQFRAAHTSQPSSEEKKGKQSNSPHFGNSYQTARLTIRVDNSTLVLSAFFTKFRISLEERFSSISQSDPESFFSLPAVCAGQWHRLSVKIGHESSTIVLDDNKLQLKQVHFPPAVLEEMRSLPVHIGGTTAPVSVALGTSSLHGCFKHIELSGVPVPLNKSKKSHKVIKEACPY
uniref:Laminin G domain-containing protein n=1 Tax=Ditylenchus dipsaci TaxID=166011 RepID=A0A915E2N1_9BILA